jgi:hypothetical protein
LVGDVKMSNLGIYVKNISKILHFFLLSSSSFMPSKFKRQLLWQFPQELLCLQTKILLYHYYIQFSNGQDI